MSKILVRASLRDKLGSNFDSYMQTLHKFIENPQAHGLNLEKLNGPAGSQKTYSIRHSKKSRIILCPIESKEGQVWVVTDVLPDHEYDVLTPLSDADKKALLSSLSLTSSFVNNNNNNNNAASGTAIREANNIEFCNNQFILLDDDQIDARTKGVTSLPLIISGAPGSGKTSVLLSIIKQNIMMSDQGDNSPRILIIAKSANLIQQLQKEWISICNVEFKDMNIDINSVEFKTPEEIYVQNYGVTNFKGEQDFLNWYSHYAATQNKLNKGDNLLVGMNEAHLIYQEFYTMSGYRTFEEYNALVSSKFSLFSDKETRAWLWQLYETYIKKLIDDKEVDLAFYPIKLAQTYHFIGIDETQDLSRQQIKSLVNQKIPDGESLAKDSFIFCVGDHQRLFGSETTLPFIRSIFWEKYQKDVTTHKVLHASYRCPQAVIKVANAVLELKAKATGNFDKNDIPHVRALHESDQVGSVHWLEKEDELTPMMNDRNNAHFVVITSPEFMDEAGRLFGPERVFTASGMKGLQAKHVLLYKFLDQEGFKAANPIIGDNFRLQDSSAKTTNGNIRHSTIFNEFFVATTRAEVSLSIYQPPVREIRFLCDPLKTFIVEQNKGKTHAQNTPTNSTSEEWQKVVDRLRAEGQHSQANAIIEKHLKAESKQAEHSNPKNENAKPENQDNNQAPKKRTRQHPIEDVLLDKPQAMEKLLKDINARDYLFNTPLNTINPARPECSLMEYLNKPEQSKIKEQLFNALVKSLSEVCNLKKPTGAQRDRQDALMGLLYHKPTNSSLPLALLLRDKLTTEQRSFVKDFMQNRLNQLNEQLKQGDINAVASLKYLGLLNTFNKEGVAPIHIAAIAGKAAVIDALKKEGADIDMLDKSGETALCRAVRYGQIKTITALLKSGADVNKSNAFDEFPLYIAVRTGNKLVIEKLLSQKGVEIEKPDRDGYSPLIIAILENRAEVIKELIKGGSNPNQLISESQSALFVALQEGYEIALQALLSSGADPNLVVGNRASAIHCAAQLGNAAAIQKLIEFGAKVNGFDNDDFSPIHVAVYKNNVDAIRVLVKSGACIHNHNVYGFPPLHYAAKLGHVESIQALVEVGADVNMVDKNGSTTLHCAAKEGHLEVVRTLINMKADVNIVNNDNSSVLHFAAYKGHVETIKLLIGSGANVNVVDKNNHTPLYLAAASGCFEAVKLLIDAGAELNVAEKASGLTALHAAAKKGDAKTIQALLDAGADVTIIADNGWSPLHYAAGNDHVEAVQILKKAGININAVDNDGSTPLNIAAYDSSLEVIQTLINLGADINLADKEGLAPIHFTVQNCFTEGTQALLDAGAQVNATDINGWTPLHHAVESGSVAMVKTLLSHKGVEVDKPDTTDGFTPLHLAASDGNKDMVITLIEDYGADISSIGNNGETPLLLAVLECKSSIVTYLLSKNASCSGAYAFTKFDLLSSAERGDDMEALLRIEKFMESKGLAIDSLDSFPLHLHELAYILGHKEIEKLILDKMALPQSSVGSRYSLFNNNNNNNDTTTPAAKPSNAEHTSSPGL